MKDLYTKKPQEVRDGVPLFSADRYWGKSPEKMLKEGLALIDEQGWQAFNNKYDNWFDFTEDQSRADWRFNIPVTKDYIVLDTGAGMGRSALPLAKVVKQVVAFDSSHSRMLYLKKKAQHEKLDNIEVCVADLFDLPFAQGIFDLVIMNGVLEWVGKTDRFNDAQQAQITSLQICKDLLKPGGYLYIGIENRWAISYLKGFDHGGLRYTSYLPRSLANIYSRWRGKGRYDTFTYSKRGYIKLLRQSGFEKEIDFYLPYPGYNRPRIVLPYNNINILKYVITYLMSSGSSKKKLVKFFARYSVFLKLYRLLFFSFNIIVKK